MTEATIEVAYVNPPAAGKKTGNVKTKDGVYYGVPPAMLSLFQPGGTYTIQYESRDWQGRKFHTVTSVVPVGGTSAAPAAASAPSHSGAGRYGSTDDTTAERIFVQGILQAFIRAGRIEPNAAAVTSGVNALRSAWNSTFGGGNKVPAAAPRQTAADEMNDSIPF